MFDAIQLRWSIVVELRSSKIEVLPIGLPHLNMPALVREWGYAAIQPVQCRHSAKYFNPASVTEVSANPSDRN